MRWHVLAIFVSLLCRGAYVHVCSLVGTARPASDLGVLNARRPTNRGGQGTRARGQCALGASGVVLCNAFVHSFAPRFFVCQALTRGVLANLAWGGEGLGE